MTLTDATLAFNRAAERMPSTITLSDLAEEEIVLLTDLDAVYREQPDPRDEKACAERDESLVRLAEYFAGHDDLVVRKVESYLGLIRHLRMLSETRTALAEQLLRKVKTTEDAEKWIKARLLTAMKVMNRDRIETPIGTVRIQQNPLKVEVLEPAMVPNEFQRTTIKVDVDKIAVRKHFEATGELVPGVEMTRGDSLRIS